MGDLEFEYPYVFLILIAFILCGIFCRYRSFSIYFPHVSLIQKSDQSSIKILSLFKWITILATITALASPVIVSKVSEDKSNGYDIVVAIDASGSMNEYFSYKDKIRKFGITKEIVGDFILKREKDNIAIVAFGQYGFIVSPLSFDKKLQLKMLENVNINKSYSNGTAIGDAIAQGVIALKSSKAKSKIIVLVTDGDESGNVRIPFDKATEIAKEEKIKIYTIGIGREGVFRKNLLDYISQETGAEAFKASSIEELKSIYKKIDELEKSEIKSKEYKLKDYYFYYPLFAAILSLLFYSILLNRSEN